MRIDLKVCDSGSRFCPCYMQSLVALIESTAILLIYVCVIVPFDSLPTRSYPRQGHAVHSL